MTRWNGFGPGAEYDSTVPAEERTVLCVGCCGETSLPGTDRCEECTPAAIPPDRVPVLEWRSITREVRHSAASAPRSGHGCAVELTVLHRPAGYIGYVALRGHRRSRELETVPQPTERQAQCAAEDLAARARVRT